tara:strand:- start:1753 stop:2991 length:1239 start_codon:yes stop_codon:yes gene_type:complete
MANNISWNESSPANTDDVLEGALRIREDKEATRERLNRDHMMGAVADPSAESGMTEGNDSGFHRRITMQERTSYNPASRLTTVNNGATTKFSEIYIEGGTGQQRLKFTSSDNTEREMVSTDQTQTLTNKTLTSPTINGASVDIDSGTIDNTTIGTTTPTTARVTKLGVNKALPSGDGDADIGGDLTVDGNTTIGSASSDTLTINATVSGNQNKSGIVGEIKMYGGATAPTGWHICNGAEISRTTYATLFAVLGTTYGIGNGSSTFNLPDLRGRIPIGAGTGIGGGAEDASGGSAPAGGDALSARALGQWGGNEKILLAHMPEHKHDVAATTSGSDGNHSHNYTDPTHDANDPPEVGLEEDGYGNTSDVVHINGRAVSGAGTHGHTITVTEANKGSGSAHTPPILCINFIIKD